MYWGVVDQETLHAGEKGERKQKKKETCDFHILFQICMCNWFILVPEAYIRKEAVVGASILDTDGLLRILILRCHDDV